MKYSYSIRGRVNEATCTRDGDIQFFLNRIKIKHDDTFKWFLKCIHPIDDYIEENNYIHSLITYLNAVELHELGHRYNWKDGCNHGKQLAFEKCAWCEETEKIYWWLL